MLLFLQSSLFPPIQLEIYTIKFVPLSPKIKNTQRERERKSILYLELRSNRPELLLQVLYVIAGRFGALATAIDGGLDFINSPLGP